MKVAIMQPYFLPYLGYWQLLASVDRFVLLDEVNFIKRGWINRNRIPIRGESHWLTIPLVKASQNRRIDELEIRDEEKWREKMAATLRATYGKAPCFGEGMELFDRIVAAETGRLSGFLAESIRTIRDFLGLPTEILASTGIGLDGPRGVGQERILKLCRALEADDYHNLPGGADLYDRADFEAEGINLKFLGTRWDEIDLASGADDPGFSLLDLAMHNPAARIRESLSSCEFT